VAGQDQKPLRPIGAFGPRITHSGVARCAGIGSLLQLESMYREIAVVSESDLSVHYSRLRNVTGLRYSARGPRHRKLFLENTE
jgi:hypothetical protein